MIAVAPARDHLGNNFGRILQVSVDDDNCVSGGVFESGADGGLMSEVARQANHAHVFVGPLNCPQQINGYVAAAVINVDELEV